MHRIFKYSGSLRCEEDDNGVAQKQLEEKRTHVECAWLLVSIISKSGEALDKYIQAHSELPQVEVLEHVSSILKECGFCPKGECIDVRNLRPYDCKISDGELHDEGHVDGTKTYLHAAEAKAVRKKVPRGWDPTYTRRSFFPYWRAVLGARCHVRVYPSYASADQLRNGWSNSMGKGSSIQSHNIGGLLEGIQQRPSNLQSRRFLSTGASTLLKVLKTA